jgi:hypothetical protein
MAANSLDVFRQNFNQRTDRSYALSRYEFDDGDYSWKKDWRDIIASDENGNYPVAHVAEYLWHRLIADGLKNYGPLERAHLYALLGTDSGLAGFLDPNDLDRVYFESDLVKPEVAGKISALAAQEIALNTANEADLAAASYRVGQAVNFITATPYMFYMEGK